MSFIVDLTDIVKYLLIMSNETAWPASERYGLTPAPHGLALVQDLLNTREIRSHGADLLADGVSTEAWGRQAVRAWSAERGAESAPPALNDHDAAKLRALREVLAGLVAGDPIDSSDMHSNAATFALSDGGDVRLEPTGQGWRWLSSALWSEVLLAQQTGSWQRLKTCHNPDCGSSFYDRSKNCSGVWHNVKTCGNAANLRASRARRRVSATH